MTRRTRTLAAATAAVCVSAGGCRAILGLDGLDFAAPDGTGGGSPATSATVSTGTVSSGTVSSGAVSSGAVSSGAVSTGTASTGTGMEDCTNGVDDNGDGKVDCADPSCAAQGYACMATPPKAWTGPAAYYQGTGVSACPSLYPTTDIRGGSGLAFDAATCSACACSTPTVSCAPAPMQAYNDGACSNKLVDMVAPMSGACVAFSAQGGGVTESPPNATSDACAASGGEATVAPFTWNNGPSLTCSGASFGGGCPTGQVCGPATAAAPFDTGCIWTAGMTTCPAGYAKHPAVTATDSRGCTPCACGAASATCTGSAALYGDAACAKQTGTLPNDGSCMNPNNIGSVLVTASVEGKPACAATGGMPAGTVAGDAHTVCCAVPN